MTQVIQSGFVDIANAPREDEALLWGQPTHAQRQLAHRLQHDSTSGSSIGQSETDMPVTTPPRQSQQPTKQSSSMFSQAFSMAGQVGGMVNRGFDILTSPLAGERTDYDDNDNDGSMDEIDSGINFIHTAIIVIIIIVGPFSCQRTGENIKSSIDHSTHLTSHGKCLREHG